MAEERPSLPRIVRFLETDDSPGASCPHCGAEGRWILNFIVDGGARRAAMRGCVKLFPVSGVAREGLRLREKARRLAKQGWKLNQNDQRALDAVEAFEDGIGDERSVMRTVQLAKQCNQDRYRGRR